MELPVETKTDFRRDQDARIAGSQADRTTAEHINLAAKSCFYLLSE